ncbi:Mn2+/Fe2+ NRAMP family transporter [Spinactinospora alkalitolerans]|uniref:Mn2+/Fe2+ NRAMP family transporter n=1 Tax=Spinactinospora alkalitolerans TaxID=687207 RepID=A0A852TZP0_9ACTN|nr:Nramp family divalent metal transporter [Spinactinospora alkalitolerans]NYE49388.1 Mn2+/Fe2+ NRAMP family transporter [Spinactinospora alkalitolerans]
MAVTEQRRASWKLIGPGFVVAATGVGTGDLVATLIAGQRFGYTLLWATIVGCLVKIALAEATGRWHLATGRTIFDGWSSLGRWTHVYFAPYIVIWGLVYGATAMSATALPLASLFPAVPLWAWAVLVGLSALLFVWFNRYSLLEKAMTALVGVMFVTVVGLAAYLTPDIGATLAGLVPTLPEGSAVYTMGLVGGVGGTITMAAYGYWVNAKGWRDAAWIKVMRWDNRVAYITTGVFVIAMLIVGAELLYSANLALESGEQGLLQLGDVLEERFGRAIAILFLIGFFSAAYSSVLGVWHGVSLLFADFVGHVRGRTNRPVEERERSWAFRAYALWLTFPPLIVVFRGRPVDELVIIYGVFGAFFMPFLALTLIWLLNSGRTPREWRNGWLSNLGLAVAGLLFIVLLGHDLWETFTGA